MSSPLSQSSSPDHSELLTTSSSLSDSSTKPSNKETYLDTNYPDGSSRLLEELPSQKDQDEPIHMKQTLSLFNGVGIIVGIIIGKYSRATNDLILSTLQISSSNAVFHASSSFHFLSEESYSSQTLLIDGI